MKHVIISLLLATAAYGLPTQSFASDAQKLALHVILEEDDDELRRALTMQLLANETLVRQIASMRLAEQAADAARERKRPNEDKLEEIQAQIIQQNEQLKRMKEIIETREVPITHCVSEEGAEYRVLNTITRYESFIDSSSRVLKAPEPVRIKPNEKRIDTDPR